MTKEKKSVRPKKEKGALKEKRGPSPYNQFIKDELAKIKKAHPDLSHKDAFKKAAESWATAPENPKSKK